MRSLLAVIAVVLVTAAGSARADVNDDTVSDNRPAGPPHGMTLSVSPAKIGMGIFGRSSEVVEIAGETLEDCEVVVRVWSREGLSLRLQYQRKVGGFFWFPTEKARLSGVPGFLGIYGSAGVEGLLSAERASTLGLGPDSGWFRSRIEISDEHTGKKLAPILEERFLSGFLAQRRLAGLYETIDNVVTVSKHAFRLHLALPKDAPVGEHAVDAWAIRDGNVLAHAEGAFRIEMTGLARVVQTAAVDHPWFYGTGCALFSVACGLLLGTVFRLRKGK